MVKRSSRKPLWAVVLAITIFVGTVGVAAAYWVGTGGGTATAVTADAADLSLSPAIPNATLSPGGQADVVLTVSNPNPSAILITSLQLATSQGSGGFAVDSGHSGCPVSVIGFTTQTNAGAGWSVPKRVATTDGVLSITLVNAVSMVEDAANSCQGALFTVYLQAHS